jgi:hypothetical protein
MENRSSNHHLDPETFVDLLEGAPVDASHRQHLGRCEECRRELEDLRETLALLESEDEGKQGSVPARRFRYLWWAAAAAVLVAALASLSRNGPVPEATELESLLPPIEEDSDYRLLLSISLETADAEVVLDAVEASTPFASDPVELPPDERTRIAEEILRMLRSRS